MEMFKHIQTQWEYFNEPQVPITKLQWLSIFCQFCIICSPILQHLKISVGIFYSKSTLALKKKSLCDYIVQPVLRTTGEFWKYYKLQKSNNKNKPVPKWLGSSAFTEMDWWSQQNKIDQWIPFQPTCSLIEQTSKATIKI